MKFTLMIVEQIQALRWQRQLDKVIKIKINKEMKKSDFDKQQIKDVFIDT